MALCAVSALLAGCGGSSDPPATSSIPAKVRAELLEDAQRVAANSGDPHPHDIEAVRTTYGEARAFRGQSQPEAPNAPVYFVAMRGEFRYNGPAPPSHGRKVKAEAPSTVMEFEVDIGPQEKSQGAATAWGDLYPSLNELGHPVHLG